jgi:hypothetical protein
MERDELELWLCGPDTALLSPFAAAEALGLPADALADTTLLRTCRRVRALQLTLAIVRDVFPDDLDVWRWLETPRRELRGMTPRAALMTGLHEHVEGLAVQTWNSAICMVGAA